MDILAIGAQVVYPAYGVAEVVGLEVRDIGGQEQKYYLLRILENDMKVMVPVTNMDQVGIRQIISADEADEVFAVLKKKEKVAEATTWNRRHRDYMEKIKTGSVIEVAKVLRDLSILKGDKELSFGERKMLDTAKSLLVREISISKGISNDDVESQFRTIFN